MFTVVATLFQQIMTELNCAESEEDRIVAITKIVIRTREAKWLLDRDPSCRQKGRPISTKLRLSDGNKTLVLGPRRGLTQECLAD
jgi:hypothetical protein